MSQTNNVIERAYQLAEECANLEEIRSRLKREGFTSVDDHLSGGQIRAALTSIIRETRLGAGQPD